MSESSTSPGPGREPFDAERFARDTIHVIEFGDAIASVLDERVIRIEEIIAAPWYRRWLLRRRLRREIRATVATWDPEYIPPGDFRARRLEAVSQQASRMADRQERARREGWPEQGRPARDGAQPGDGLPR